MKTYVENDTGTEVPDFDELHKSNLDNEILNKIKNRECISEPELLDRISEIYDELKLSIAENEYANEQLEKANHNVVVNSCCKHYKGQHDNNYYDCTVVCDLFDDEYVSRDSCCNCKEFEVK